MKTRTGYLIKRGKNYYAMWTIGGKKFSQTTGKSDKKEAGVVLSRIMEPYLIENEKRMLESVKARIEGAAGEITALNDAKNPPPSLSKSWDLYLEAPNRRDSGALTLRQYESHFDQFIDWLKDKHPEVKTLRDVTQEIADQYAKNLIKRGLSGNSFNIHTSFLKMFFKVLHEEARLTVNPWLEITRKQQLPNSRRELTIEELRKVCNTAIGDNSLKNLVNSREL